MDKSDMTIEEVQQIINERFVAECRVAELETAWSRSVRACEEAGARLRAISNIIGSFDRNRLRGTIWENAILRIESTLSGDLPPCPECAKANAQLAAVGERWKPIMEELKKWAVEGLWENARNLDAILASDSEVIAVVEGWMNKGRTVFYDEDSQLAIYGTEDAGDMGDTEQPVTVTVTRNTKAKEGE